MQKREVKSEDRQIESERSLKIEEVKPIIETSNKRYLERSLSAFARIQIGER